MSLDEIEEEVLAMWMSLLLTTERGSQRERIVIDSIRRMLNETD